MGDPRRFRKQYTGPRHPWQGAVIELERKLMTEFGLKNKTELWKMQSILTSMKDLAKKLIPLTTAQATKEKQQLLTRLERMGLLKHGAELDDILSITIHHVLNRRLQSLVFTKKLARSMKQARQVIVHRHISVADQKMSPPGYLVPIAEEDKIAFAVGSKMVSPEHPERPQQKSGE